MQSFAGKMLQLCQARALGQKVSSLSSGTIKICVTENIHLFSATGLLLFLFVFIGVVRAKLGLKVFCFFYTYIFNNHSSNTKWGVEKKHRAHTTSKMRGCSASRLRHSFRLANVCQMCCAGWSGDTERAILPLTVTGGS